METVFAVTVVFAQILCLQGEIFLPVPMLNREQDSICPTSESLATAKEETKNSVRDALSLLVFKPECGGIP